MLVGTLFVARVNGLIIAGTVIYIYKNTVHIQYMVASSLWRELGTLDLVISTVVIIYKSSHKYFYTIKKSYRSPSHN